MIEAYCKQFFGYGRWDTPVWFVGLEEAGSGTLAELQARLAAWDQRGRRELEDAPAFYHACGQQRWHGRGANLQTTRRTFQPPFTVLSVVSQSLETLVDQNLTEI